MFRPLCMAIFRFSVQCSVRRFLFLVLSGGERDLTLQYMGGKVRSHSPLPDQTRNRNLLTEYCTENLKMAIHKGRNMLLNSTNVCTNKYYNIQSL